MESPLFKALSLPSLAGRISPVSFGFTCGLVFHQPRNASVLGTLARLCLCRSCGSGGRFLRGSDQFQSGLLFKL